MEEDNKGLEMSLFNTGSIELNLTDLPEIDEVETIDNDIQTDVDSDEDTTDIDNLNEDEDPEKVVEENEDQEEEGDEDDDSPNLYSSFASVLNEQGLLPSLDLQNAKVESIEDLTTVFKSEIDNQVKTYLLEKIGEDGYQALEKGVTLSEYQNYQETVTGLDSLTEDNLKEDLELSKKIIYEDYLSQGIDEKRALRILKKTIDLGDEAILEDAKESLQSLKDIQEVKLQKLQEERETARQEQLQLQEKIDNDLKNTIYNSKEFIEGIPVTKAIKDRVYDSITKIVSKGPNGVMENALMKERREDPIGFDARLYYFYEITKGFKDTSKLVSSSKSKAISTLEKQLRQNKFGDTSAPSYLTDPESYSGLGSELVL